MPNIIFNVPLYFTSIITCFFTELAPKLTATASVAQSVERWSRDSQPEALELHFSQPSRLGFK